LSERLGAQAIGNSLDFLKSYFFLSFTGPNLGKEKMFLQSK